MKTSMIKHPIKMIDLISDLYKHYKVLNKLNEKQSFDFQRQIVTLLVDSKQNVDHDSFINITEEHGIAGLVLDILAKVISRNPFKNQFELNRNLATITENIKKDQQELQKKQKILQRKEEKIKSIEDSFMNNIKQKIQIMENQTIQKILKKETQIKKGVTQLINQLKAKEKLVFERYEQAKSNAKILAQIEQKEKSINQKLKLIQKRQKEIKSKDSENDIMKKQAEIQQCKQNIQKLRQNQKEATKKYKNLELAYKKLKNDKDKDRPKEPYFSPKSQNIPKLIIQNKNELQFDDLQLSRINQIQRPNACEQLITYLGFQQVNYKLQSIKKVLSKPQQTSTTSQLNEIKHLLNINQDQKVEKIQILHSSQEQDSISDEYMPSCLSPHQEQKSLESILKKIRNITLQKDIDKQTFIKQNTLLKLMDQCYSANTPHQVCQVLLQKILELIEQSSHYLEIISYLANDKVVQFLQHIYLSHQTNSDIVETATLVLSRIKLKDFQLKLNNSFKKALQIRLKVENKGSFLYGNIHFILN